MYKDNSQLRIEDFAFPYGKLDPENDWVKLAALVPWDVAEERYAARFVNNGHAVHPARMALGALLIQGRLKCIDQWLVKHIGGIDSKRCETDPKAGGSFKHGHHSLRAAKDHV